MPRGGTSTPRLYLRVVALGCLWCLLGIALGTNLFVRLRAITESAGDLSAHTSAQADLALNERAGTAATAAAKVEDLATVLVGQSHRINREALATGVVAFGLGITLTVIVARMVRRQELAQANDRERQEFHSRVSDAFGMTHADDGAYALVTEIIDRLAPGLPAEMLLADSSRAHLTPVAATHAARDGACGVVGDGGDRSASLCPVRSPSHCPAVRRGHAMTFSSSEDFDSCPNLRGRPGGACSGTCVPISIMGQHVGVLHAVTPDRHPLAPAEIERLSILAAKAGERLGVLRAFAQSEHQSARDPLTGLLNRRSLEVEVQRLQRSGCSFSIAYADIDHFKRLNDTHGHETGDKALRLLSRVLREALRPSDVTARWGGEEFVILLPDLDLDTARVTLDRLRSAVVESTGAGHVPHFSVSFGVSYCAPEDDFFERLAEADSALLAAKSAGRNRVIAAKPAMATLTTAQAA